MLSDCGIGADEVLIITPRPKGRKVITATDEPSVASMLDAGESLAAAIAPFTAPPDIGDLPLFADSGRR